MRICIILHIRDVAEKIKREAVMNNAEVQSR